MSNRYPWTDGKLYYYRRSHETSEETEISYEKALDILLGSWKDNEMTRSMLTQPNNIQCRFSDVIVKEGKGENCMVLMAGLWNQVPDWAWDETEVTGWKEES